MAFHLVPLSDDQRAGMKLGTSHRIYNIFMMMNDDESALISCLHINMKAGIFGKPSNQS